MLREELTTVRVRPENDILDFVKEILNKIKLPYLQKDGKDLYILRGDKFCKAALIWQYGDIYTLYADHATCFEA